MSEPGRTAAPREPRRLWRRLAIGVGLLLVVLLASVAGGFAWLSSSGGKEWLRETIESTASTPGEFELSIGGLTGSLPGAIQLNDVSIKDRDGPWLTIATARLVWHPFDLLRRTLAIEEIAVSDVQLVRPPESPPEEPVEEPAEPFSLPALPLDVTVQKLSVDGLALGEAILGQPAVFDIEGSLAGQVGDALRSALRIARQDGPPGIVEAEATFRPGQDTLTLKAKIFAAEGGLLATLLDLPGLPATELALSGDGPLSDWQGRLTASLQGLATLQSDLRITREPTLQLAMTGRVESGNLPDAPPWPLLAGETRFDLAVAWLPDSVVDLHHLALAGAALDAEISGQFDTETLEAQLSSTIILHDPDAIARIAKPAQLERVELKADLNGPVTQPALDLELIADAPEGPGFSARQATLQARVETDAVLDSAQPLLSFESNLSISNPVVDPRDATAPLLGNAIGLKADGTFALASLMLDITHLSMSAEQVGLDGLASVDLQSGALNANAKLSLRDLATLRNIAGMDLAGSLVLDTELDGRDFGATLFANTTGGLSDFQSGIAALDALLGNQPTFGADIALDQEEGLSVTALRLDAAEAWITGEATMSASFDEIGATISGGLDRLAALSDSLAMPLAGNVTFESTLEGPLSALKSQGRIVLRDGSFNDFAVSQATVSYDLDNLVEAPHGQLRIDSDSQAGSMAGSTSIALKGEALAFNDLKLAGEGTQLTGDLAVNLSSMIASGTITAEVSSLSPWLALAGQEGDGAIGARIALSGETGRQSVQLAANLAELSYPLGGGDALRVASAQVRASLPDLAAPLTADAQVEASGLAAGPAQLSGLTASLQGQPEGAAFALAARGELMGELDLTTKGRVALQDAATSVSLDELQGTLVSRSISLDRPANLVLQENGFALDGLRLAFSGGQLAADGTLNDQTLSADLRLADLPLDLVEIFAPDTAVDGNLSGQIQLSGPRTDPKGNARFETKGLRLRDVEDVPEIAAALQAGWADGRVEATASLSGFAADPIALRAAAPLRLDGETLAVNLPNDEPISAELTWRGDLAEVWPLVPIDGHRLSGNADLDLKADGTLAAPRLSGQVAINQGEYENLDVGTLLKDLALDLRLSGNRIDLASLTATDGGSGHLEVTGNVDVEPERGFPFNIRARADDFVAVRRDDATATAGADITLSGSTERTSVSGEIKVDRAEIRIRRDLPPEVVDLQVVEVNSAAIGKADPAESDGATAPANVDLDLTVDMPGRIFVRGQGLDSEWSGKLAIKGTAAAPVITGELAVIRGQLDLIGRTFVFDKGIVSFDGGKEINPLLDVVARYERDDLTVNALVTGTAQDPDFALTSTPTLPQDEIVSRVLFDKSSSQLSAIEAAQLAQAVAELTGQGGGSGGVLDFARNLLGVDVLRVETDGTGGPAVSAGQYVSDNVFVGVKQGTTAGSGTVGVEVELTPNISLKSDVGQTGESDIGINFKWDY